MSEESKIPTLGFALQRSASVRVRGERTFGPSSIPRSGFPAIGETCELKCTDSKLCRPKPINKLLRSASQASGLNQDDDLDSVKSFGSGISNLSAVSNCEHACFARNGTTFSGRSMKYIVHCQNHEGDGESYLTPTQRANKKIKQLKSLLQLAKEKLLEKEKEIFKLTKEVVELRLFKASVKPSPVVSNLSSPIENTTIDKSMITHLELNSTCNEKEFCNDTSTDLSPIKNSYCFDSSESMREKINLTPDFLLSSLADSGHYEDLASSLSLHSKDSLGCWDKTRPNSSEPRLKSDDTKLTEFYEAKLEERKSEYQKELTEILKAKEEDNLKILNEFDAKLKEEQIKYENKFRTLLKATEEEKLEIIENFEKKLEVAKQNHFVQKYEKQMQTEQTYSAIFEQEKKKYERVIAEMKINFETEKVKIEKMYDDSMTRERSKFEDVVNEIQGRSEERIRELLEKIFYLETRYGQIEPDFEAAKKRIMELEKENEAMRVLLAEQEERNKSLFLKMYMKGQESAKYEQNEREPVEGASSGITVPELLVQLQITETELDNLKAMYSRLAETHNQTRKQFQNTNGDAEATLQFLKSAVYYFLTDRDNQVEHLRAIESILGYSTVERVNIEKSCLG